MRRYSAAAFSSFIFKLGLLILPRMGLQDHHRLYLSTLSRYGSLSFHEHTQTSFSLSLFLPRSNALCWGSHRENCSASHSNQNRAPEQLLLIAAQLAWTLFICMGMGIHWAILRQLRRRALPYFMRDAPLPAYMPPRRRLHDGSMLILINT